MKTSASQRHCGRRAEHTSIRQIQDVLAGPEARRGNLRARHYGHVGQPTSGSSSCGELPANLEHLTLGSGRMNHDQINI